MDAFWYVIGGVAAILFLIAFVSELVTDIIWAKKTLVELREKREKRQQEGKDTTCGQS